MNWIFPQTSRGSFSAVSTPIFAKKYALESSWRDLQDYMLLHRSDLNISTSFHKTFSHFDHFRQILQNLIIFKDFSSNFAQILMKNYRKFAKYSRKIQYWTFLKFLNFWWILTNVPEIWPNPDRTLIWKVRMVRSLAYRTFQPRLEPMSLIATPTFSASLASSACFKFVVWMSFPRAQTTFKDTSE